MYLENGNKCNIELNSSITITTIQGSNCSLSFLLVISDHICVCSIGTGTYLYLIIIINFCILIIFLS